MPKPSAQVNSLHLLPACSAPLSHGSTDSFLAENTNIHTQGARFFAFLAFDIVFLYAVLKNRQDLLNLHWAILLVIIVATLEALAWFLAFDVMNSSGVPYCCPFPPVVIFAMVREHRILL